MEQFSWRIKGICVSVPSEDEIDLFNEFVEKILRPGGCNLIVMLVRYRYQFRSHPECAEKDAVSPSTVAKIVQICRNNKIKLVPKMNLLGHQSFKGKMEGLLNSHPEFDETPNIGVEFYCRSLCPNHPGIGPYIFDLVDELAEAFNADTFHIGCDEVFDIGKCPRCRNIPTYQIFANWVNKLTLHNKENGIKTLMWGDRLLNGVETGYGGWEASGNFTDPSIGLVDKDIIICDWHYEDMDSKGNGTYPSIEIFSKAGFHSLLCPWKNTGNAMRFLQYGRDNDVGLINGFLATTWCGLGDLMRYMLRGDVNSKNEYVLTELSKTLLSLFKS